MKKLRKHAAVFHKDSVFRPEDCFNYRSATFERLDTQPTDKNLEFEAKYRFVLGPDEYDYVVPGAVMPGWFPNPFETKESTEKFVKELDAAWERWKLPRCMKRISYEKMCEMKNRSTSCGPIPEGVDPTQFLLDEADYHHGDYGPPSHYAYIIYDEVKTYAPGEAMYERVQGSYWLLYPSWVCGGCGKFTVNEVKDDVRLCDECIKHGTPGDVYTTDGQSYVEKHSK